MSKSRRQCAYNRKMEAFCRRTEELASAMSSRLVVSKTPHQVERERVMSEQLKSLFTPEYIQDLKESTNRIAHIGRQMEDLSGRLTHLIRQHRPAGLGSHRTKRLRKKMWTYQ